MPLILFLLTTNFHHSSVCATNGVVIPNMVMKRHTLRENLVACGVCMCRENLIKSNAQPPLSPYVSTCNHTYTIITALYEHLYTHMHKYVCTYIHILYTQKFSAVENFHQFCQCSHVLFFSEFFSTIYVFINPHFTSCRVPRTVGEIKLGEFFSQSQNMSQWSNF